MCRLGSIIGCNRALSKVKTAVCTYIVMKEWIENGEFQIFSGELYDQEHQLRNENGGGLSPEEIIRMDWLADNVVGHIPKVEQLVEEAVPMVKIQGIESDRG